MAHKTTAEDILATRPITRDKQKHGFRLHAARLCRWGKQDEAKAFCAKRGIEYPPFHNPLLLIPNGNTGTGKAPPLPVIPQIRDIRAMLKAEPPPPDPFAGLVTYQGEPIAKPDISHEIHDAPTTEKEPEMSAPAPVQLAPPPPVTPPEMKGITATVWGFPINPRIVTIRLPDGKIATMRKRKGLICGREVQVEIESGSGETAFYREVGGRV